MGPSNGSQAGGGADGTELDVAEAHHGVLVELLHLAGHAGIGGTRAACHTRLVWIGCVWMKTGSQLWRCSFCSTRLDLVSVLNPAEWS